MKKIYLIFAGMFVLATGQVSCSSEDAVTKEKTEAFKFEKTPEMVNFETALRTYMRNKQQGGTTTDTKSKTDNELVVKEKAMVLLTSLGKQQLAGEENMGTEQLLLVAMKEYSKKLTSMYHERKINLK